MHIGLFVLRVVAGGLFAAHGAQKLFGIYGGAGIEGTATFFERVGLRPGRTHATAAGSLELAGGLLLALGLFTPIAAIAIIAVMTAAVLTVHLANGPWSTDNGYEYNLVLMAIALALAGVGPGNWSLDHAFGIDMNGAGWALIALLAGLAGGYGAVLTGRHEGARTTSPTTS